MGEKRKPFIILSVRNIGEEQNNEAKLSRGEKLTRKDRQAAYIKFELYHADEWAESAELLDPNGWMRVRKNGVWWVRDQGKIEKKDKFQFFQYANFGELLGRAITAGAAYRPVPVK